MTHGAKLTLSKAGLIVWRISQMAAMSTIPHTAAWVLLRPCCFVLIELESIYWKPPIVSISTAIRAPTTMSIVKIVLTRLLRPCAPVIAE